jgi:hypothetical protein
VVSGEANLMSLQGRCVPAGAVSRAFLSRLLGISELGGKYRIRAAAWVDHAVEASVPLGKEEVVFRIERRTEGADGLVVCPHLVLYYRGKDIPPELAEAVERYAPQHLESHTIESLAESIASDPELGDTSLPMPPGTDERERPRSLLDTWGIQDAYADYFAAGELARSQLDSLDPGALFTFIQHSDCECLHVNPHTGGSVVWLVNYPWDNRIRHKMVLGEQLDLTSAAVEGMLTTDLDENDVIMGNPEKLERILKRAEQVYRATGKTLFFSNTCTPVVTGEDVESVVKRFKKSVGCPLLYLTVTPRSMVNVFHDVLVTRRLEAEQAAVQSRERTVNLVGFRSDPETSELVELLGLAGVSVNCILLPDLTFELVDRLPQAALNVFLPNQLWQHLYDQLQFDSKIPFINPPAPFGLAGTIRWVKEVAAFFETPVDPGEALQDRVADIHKKWGSLHQEAGKFRLGFIIRSDEIHLLTNPATSWGVPLVEMLEELGFGLEVYIKVADRESARRSSHQVYDAFRERDRHLIKAFDSMAGMNQRIAESRAAAFFSSHFYDWRLTSAGKNIFSLQHFEMGLRGAARTARRLLGICRTPFYHRYRHFLSRTPEGLRKEP